MLFKQLYYLRFSPVFSVIYLFVFLEFIAIPKIYAQNSMIDSLTALLKTFEEDRDKVLAYNNLSFLLRNDKLEQSQQYAEKALTLSTKLKFNSGIARSHALLGLIKLRQGLYEPAMANQFEALKIYELLNDLQGVAWSYNNIANIYTEENSFNLALSFYEKSMEIQRKIDSKQGIATVMKNISSLYITKKQYDEALPYLRQALPMAKSVKDMRIVSIVLSNIGDVYYHRQKYDSALYFFDEALKIYEQERNDVEKCHTLNSIGSTYLFQNQTDKALNYHNRALVLSDKIGFRYEKQASYLAISKAYLQRNEHKNSLWYFQLYAELKDSLLNQASSTKIAHLQAEFDLEKKQEHIQLLTKEAELKDEKIKEKNILLFFSIGVAILIVILMLVLWKSNRHRQQANIILTKINDELNHKNIEVKLQNEEIQQQKEELSSMNESLGITLKQLEANQREIVAQKTEIEILNSTLEYKITERTEELQEAVEKLVNQNADLEQFSFVVSHNLRAPIAQILGLTTLFRLTQEENNENYEITFRLKAAAESLDVVISDLNKVLDIKHSTSKKYETVSLLKVIERIEQRLTYDLLHTQAQVKTFYNNINTTNDYEIYTIKEYVENIVYQLFSNAIKFREPSRKLEITIQLENIENYMVLTITDNGLGLHDTQKLFHLYQRQHLDLSGKALGLFIAKVQIDVLESKIEVQTKLGVGTSFKVYFCNTLIH